MAILTTKTPEARKKTASTKLTEDELARFERFAKDREKSPGELIRELILREMNITEGGTDVDPALCEIVGVQLLLMNVLKPLAAGAPINAAAFDQIVQQVHHAKRDIAQRITQEGA